MYRVVGIKVAGRGGHLKGKRLGLYGEVLVFWLVDFFEGHPFFYPKKGRKWRKLAKTKQRTSVGLEVSLSENNR